MDTSVMRGLLQGYLAELEWGGYGSQGGAGGAGTGSGGSGVAAFGEAGSNAGEVDLGGRPAGANIDAIAGQ